MSRSVFHNHLINEGYVVSMLHITNEGYDGREKVVDHAQGWKEGTAICYCLYATGHLMDRLLDSENICLLKFLYG
jgi:hypothetical protein